VESGGSGARRSPVANPRPSSSPIPHACHNARLCRRRAGVAKPSVRRDDARDRFARRQARRAAGACVAAAAAAAAAAAPPRVVKSAARASRRLKPACTYWRGVKIYEEGRSARRGIKRVARIDGGVPGNRARASAFGAPAPVPRTHPRSAPRGASDCPPTKSLHARRRGSSPPPCCKRVEDASACDLRLAANDTEPDAD
jgi:hypothetical protein